MSTVLIDFGTKYVRVWDLNNAESLTNDNLLRSVRCQLWMRKNGDFYIGKKVETQIEGTPYEGFSCSLEVLHKLLLFPEEAELHIRNITVEENHSSVVCSSHLPSNYEEIIKVFLVQLMADVLTTTEIDDIEKVLFIKSKLLHDNEEFFSRQLKTVLPVTFVSKFETVAAIYAIEKFAINEQFITIDLGESHCDFIVAEKTSEESITEIRAEYCKVGGRYIDILIYNFIISELKSRSPDDTFELQMETCEAAKKKIKTGPAFITYKCTSKAQQRRSGYSFQADAFEGLSKPYVKKVISFVKKCVRGCDLNEIKTVFLVGGSSKVSEIEREFERIFGSRLNVEIRKIL